MFAFILIVAFLASISTSYSWTTLPQSKRSFLLPAASVSTTESTLATANPVTIQQSVTTGMNRALAASAGALSLSTLIALAVPQIASADSDASTSTPTKKTKKPKVLETPDLGIKYIEVTKGSGPYPNPGDFVVITYTAFLSNGTVFDSTEIKGRKPLSFKFGQSQVIPGLESVVGELQPGGQATCNIPAKFAYGSKGVCVEVSYLFISLTNYLTTS